MIDFKRRLREQIRARLADRYPLSPGDLEMTVPPDTKMGDLALTFPFQLAKKMKTAPRAIAQDAAARLAGLEGTSRVEVAGAGYVNFYLDRAALFRAWLTAGTRSGLGP